MPRYNVIAQQIEAIEITENNRDVVSRWLEKHNRCLSFCPSGHYAVMVGDSVSLISKELFEKLYKVKVEETPSCNKLLEEFLKRSDVSFTTHISCQYKSKTFTLPGR